MINSVLSIFLKDALLEARRKTSFAGILVYVIGTVYVCYLSFRLIIDVPTWNALYWIILLFAAVNAVARNFLVETRGIQLYNYLIFSPSSFIISRILFNVIYLFSIAMVTYLFYALFLGNLVQDIPMFLISAFLGTACLSSILTLMSAIASSAGGNPSLVAILGFPVILPTLLTVIRSSKNAIDGLAWSVNMQYLIVLGTLFILSLVLAILLFPYLWKD